MIRINQIKIGPSDYYDNQEIVLKKKVARLLRIPEGEIKRYRIVKQSIDARKKPDIFYVLTLDVEVEREERTLEHCRDGGVGRAVLTEYHFPPKGKGKLRRNPIIIGAGPAGLFCAYLLAQNGYCPIVLERGGDADSRKEAVELFWKTGELDLNSNVQFGEGGAGTFSDGKLNTLVKDKYGRNKKVLEIFVEAGAPERILYENKPHLGTDLLIPIVKNMREAVIAWGGQVLFHSEVTDFLIEGNKIKGVEINHERTLESEAVILAPGHSARDTIEKLYSRGVPMESKSFAVGLRVEHRQEMIDQSQYGKSHDPYLPVSDYKVTARTKNDRGVYSFCMCPGGYVVNASSEQGRLAVNGMSYSRRDAGNANSAVIVSVTPEDYGSSHPLAGIQFQRELERKAYALGKGSIPVQYYEDFVADRVSVYREGCSEPCIKGQFMYSNLRGLMPEELNASFMEGMEQFHKKIKGFASKDTLLSGIESRTSCPVRMLRDEDLQSEVKGLYPCGEGAGYAGGITSAAMDGIKAAEKIAERFTPM